MEPANNVKKLLTMPINCIDSDDVTNFQSIKIQIENDKDENLPLYKFPTSDFTKTKQNEEENVTRQFTNAKLHTKKKVEINPIVTIINIENKNGYRKNNSQQIINHINIDFHEKIAEKEVIEDENEEQDNCCVDCVVF